MDSARARGHEKPRTERHQGKALEQATLSDCRERYEKRTGKRWDDGRHVRERVASLYRADAPFPDELRAAHHATDALLLNWPAQTSPAGARFLERVAEAVKRLQSDGIPPRVPSFLDVLSAVDDRDANPRDVAIVAILTLGTKWLGLAPEEWQTTAEVIDRARRRVVGARDAPGRARRGAQLGGAAARS